MADEKKKEKKEKPKKKKGKAVENDELEDEEESFGSKVVLFFVTLIIIAVWVVIIGILIRFDVGGFGSTVLYPILKDVPVVNQILPDVSTNPEDEAYMAYDTLESAIARIKELELENSSLLEEINSDSTLIEELQAQIAELQTYKEEQASFELIKEKFYEEVVFSDNSPDISEYRAYYESIDPENAEVLYKQVVEQMQADAQIADYVKTYSSMKPKDAAEIFDTMTDDLQLVAKILENMGAQARSDILAEMNPDTAAKLTQIMEP